MNETLEIKERGTKGHMPHHARNYKQALINRAQEIEQKLNNEEMFFVRPGMWVYLTQAKKKKFTNEAKKQKITIQEYLLNKYDHRYIQRSKSSSVDMIIKDVLKLFDLEHRQLRDIQYKADPDYYRVMECIKMIDEQTAGAVSQLVLCGKLDIPTSKLKAAKNLD